MSGQYAGPRVLEYVEEVEFLTSCGLGYQEILAKLNTTPAALTRGLFRAGRPDLANPFERVRSSTRKSVCGYCGGPCKHGVRRCRSCYKAARRGAS